MLRVIINVMPGRYNQSSNPYQKREGKSTKQSFRSEKKLK